MEFLALLYYVQFHSLVTPILRSVVNDGHSSPPNRPNDYEIGLIVKFWPTSYMCNVSFRIFPAMQLAFLSARATMISDSQM